MGRPFSCRRVFPLGFPGLSCVTRGNLVERVLVKCECSRRRADACMLLDTAFTQAASSSGRAYAAESRGPEAVYPACTHAAKGRVQHRCCSKKRWSSVRRRGAQSPLSEAGKRKGGARWTERRCAVAQTVEGTEFDHFWRSDKREVCGIRGAGQWLHVPVVTVRSENPHELLSDVPQRRLPEVHIAGLSKRRRRSD